MPLPLTVTLLPLKAGEDFSQPRSALIVVLPIGDRGTRIPAQLGVDVFVVVVQGELDGQGALAALFDDEFQQILGGVVTADRNQDPELVRRTRERSPILPIMLETSSSLPEKENSRSNSAAATAPASRVTMMRITAGQTNDTYPGDFMGGLRAERDEWGTYTGKRRIKPPAGCMVGSGFFLGAARVGLGQQHARQHQGTPDQAPRGQSLAQHQPAAQGGEHGFEAQDDRRVGRPGAPLGHHLQGVGHRHRQQARIEDGQWRPP